MALGVVSILKVADVISDVRKAFVRIEALEQDQRRLEKPLTALDARVREAEAGVREARAEIKLEAVRETQTIVNSVQDTLYGQIKELSLQVERLGARQGVPIDRLQDRSDG